MQEKFTFEKKEPNNIPESTPFDPNDEKRLAALHAKFETPKPQSIFSKMHQILLGSVLAAGVSTAAAGGNNKPVELFSNSPTDTTLRTPKNQKEVFSNSKDPKENKRARTGNVPNQPFSNSADPEENKRVNDANRGKAKELFSN
jgi:hypothetical protein